MYLFGDQVEKRNAAPLGGENPEESAARGNRQEPESMNHDRARAFRALLTQIMELHMAGRSAVEIAVQVLTTESEKPMFGAAMLIEIIFHYAHRYREERAL